MWGWIIGAAMGTVVLASGHLGGELYKKRAEDEICPHRNYYDVMHLSANYMIGFAIGVVFVLAAPAAFPWYLYLYSVKQAEEDEEDDLSVGQSDEESDQEDDECDDVYSACATEEGFSDVDAFTEITHDTPQTATA